MQRLRVHTIAPQSEGKLRRAYQRHGVQFELPTYDERIVRRGQIINRARAVAPGYVMLREDASYVHDRIAQEEGRTLVRQVIGTMSEHDLDRMKSVPSVDRVPKSYKPRIGDKVMVKTIGLAGKIKHLTGTCAIVVFDKLMGEQRTATVAFSNLEYYQQKPGS